MEVTSISTASTATLRERVVREDLVLFINACFSCSGQREFYSDSYSQRVSIDFLHSYILGNYRLLYARTLAAGVNHFNQAQIILNLLATGRDTLPEHREEEGVLIAAALRALPPQRAWRILQTLRERRINNRRARAIVRDFLNERRDPGFDAVKYRVRVKDAVKHTHIKPPGEIGTFLFRGWRHYTYRTEILENYRKAYYSAAAIYTLPYTVAEGMAVRHRVPRDRFLEGIAERMTAGEKLRLQKTAERAKVTMPELDWGRLPLTRLALYTLSLTEEERRNRREALQTALESAARFTLRRAPLRLGVRRIAAVLDASYSASGSSEKRRRPLAVALASHYLLRAAATGEGVEYRDFWTNRVTDPLFVRATGQTDLATPILDALDWGADLIVVISDGCENDPPRGAYEVLRVFRTALDPERHVTIVHCNPVFDSEDLSLRGLSPLVPTVGLRDAEDLPTMLGFARFADGDTPLAELERYMAARVAELRGEEVEIEE